MTTKTKPAPSTNSKPEVPRAKIGQRILYRRHPSSRDVCLGLVTSVNDQNCDAMIFTGDYLVKRVALRHINDPWWLDPGNVSDEESGAWQESELDAC